jgi:hypothetical protein
VGLYDEVRCEYPLPNPSHQALLFQTKDLENLLDLYLVTRRGRLVRKKTGLLEPRSCHVLCPIHQDLRIHTSVEVGPEEHEWVEYVLRFTEGRVTKVRRSRDRRRFRLDTWAPEALSREAAPAAATGDSQASGGLTPGLLPRRPTVEEYCSHTPEKLELIDGHIPGEERLLLLLLTGMGLRRAAELVGLKLWRSAAAPTRWSLERAQVRPRRRRRP